MGHAAPVLMPEHATETVGVADKLAEDNLRGRTAHALASKSLSAGAPEFVPIGAAPQNVKTLGGPCSAGEPKKVMPFGEAVMGSNNRAPLCEITNLAFSDGRDTDFNALKLTKPRPISIDASGENFIHEDSDEGNDSNPDFASTAEVDDAETVSLDGLAAPPTSPATDASGGKAVPDQDAPESNIGSEAGDFPSVGSASHETGGCKRCNFFAKGRCQNGRDCQFCHLPHEKKKLSRQEKRERREAWLAQQETGEAVKSKNAAPQNCLSAQVDEFVPAQAHVGKEDTSSNQSFLTLSNALADCALKVVHHTEPLQNLGAVGTASGGCTMPPPPGLAPPTWQPDAESSPNGSAMPTPLGHATSTQPTPQSGSAGVLATSPTEHGNSMLFQRVVPTSFFSGSSTPLATTPHAIEPSSLPAHRAAASVRSVATQTDDDFGCTRCNAPVSVAMDGQDHASETHAAAGECVDRDKVEDHIWSRAHLLSLRPPFVKGCYL